MCGTGRASASRLAGDHGYSATGEHGTMRRVQQPSSSRSVTHVCHLLRDSSAILWAHFCAVWGASTTHTSGDQSYCSRKTIGATPSSARRAGCPVWPTKHYQSPSGGPNGNPPGGA